MKLSSYLALFCCCSLAPLTAAAQSGRRMVAATDSTIASTPEVKVLIGTVLGARDQPLAGASVSVVTEPYQAGVTNSVGGYVLRSKVAAPVLRVSYAGYEGAEVAITDSEPLTIRLEPINKYERNLKKRMKAAEKDYRKP